MPDWAHTPCTNTDSAGSWGDSGLPCASSKPTTGNWGNTLHEMKQHRAVSQHCSLHRVSPHQPSGLKAEACAVHRAQPVACTVHTSYWITGQSALTCPACQSPACLCKEEIKEGMDKSNLSSTGQPEPCQKAGWGMPPQTRGQQGNRPGRHTVNLSWNPTPQKNQWESSRTLI